MPCEGSNAFPNVRRQTRMPPSQPPGRPPPCFRRRGKVVIISREWRAPRCRQRQQGLTDLISPSVFLAVLQTLFAALLSFGSFGVQSSAHGHRQGLAVREAAAISFTLADRAIAAREEADRSDPHKSGGNALPPTVAVSFEILLPTRVSPVALLTLFFAERSARAHPATGPPLV
jgi:hypothetical protein